MGRRQHQFRGRGLKEALPVCALPAMLVFSIWPLLLSVPLGIATGYSWWRLGSGRLTSGGIAMAAVLCEYVVLGLWSSATDIMGFLFSMCGVFLAGLLAAMFGLRRELDQREWA